MIAYKLVFAALLSLSLFGSCSKSSKSADTPAGGGGAGGGGSTAPTFASHYKRNCTALGTTLHGATHTDDLLIFTSNQYTNSQSFYSDSSCVTEIYRFVIGGNYTIGAAITTPAGGYNVTFTPTSTSIYSATGAEGTTLNTDCSTALSTSASSSQSTSTIGFLCGSQGYVVENTPTYNVFVLGATLDFGSVHLNNLGQLTQGAVSTTTSLSYETF